MAKFVNLSIPSTEYAHPKCIANSDNNCSKKISKEHYISAVLLRQMTNQKSIQVAGLKWQKTTTLSNLPIAGLASSILCQRHNNALSGIDSDMGRFFQAIGDFDAMFVSQNLGSQDEFRDIDGDAIELWMIKCIVGLVASKSVGGTLKKEVIDILFGRIQLPDYWGLYCKLPATKVVHQASSLLIETFVSPEQVIFEVRFLIRGFPFFLVLGKPDNPDEFGFYRPKQIIFRNDQRAKVLHFTWGSGAKSDALIYKFDGTYTGEPPYTQEFMP